MPTGCSFIWRSIWKELIYLNKASDMPWLGLELARHGGAEYRKWIELDRYLEDKSMNEIHYSGHVNRVYVRIPGNNIFVRNELVDHGSLGPGWSGSNSTNNGHVPPFTFNPAVYMGPRLFAIDQYTSRFIFQLGDIQVTDHFSSLHRTMSTAVVTDQILVSQAAAKLTGTDKTLLNNTTAIPCPDSRLLDPVIRHRTLSNNQWAKRFR
ncbi:uncharacterized protein HD556DRAFT_1310308 [Suillus plorans]|uniref:Uncharacterized protein n=1 Tax=Suillus plorans TaxID=116603 RepID=A0A9P7DFH8_9AGAM|nr:uncharacterized protein HD556DRAFT_1310308 [Suillus plorans]KAG1790756.1 hypothetical protein HD556DRAFT_1310308 [Suillus plorans]